jgi:hypothetical protein
MFNKYKLKLNSGQEEELRNALKIALI